MTNYPNDKADLDLDNENHFVFLDTEWPEDLKNAAEGINFCCRPNSSVTEMANEVIAAIQNRDRAKVTYITVAIFQRSFPTLQPEGVEQVVNRISHYMREPQEDWWASNSNQIFKVYLTYAAIPYWPAFEHYWPEIAESNQLLKNETVSLYSTPLNTNKWLTKRYPYDTRKNMMLCGLYLEYDNKKGLGHTLNYNGKRKLNNAYLSHHTKGVKSLRSGTLVIEKQPVPLEKTNGYKMAWQNNDNNWIHSYMGEMYANIYNMRDYRAQKQEEENMRRREAAEKQEKEAEEKREAQVLRQQLAKERREEEERLRAKQETQLRTEKENLVQEDFQQRLARMREMEKEYLAPSRDKQFPPDSLEGIIEEKDRVIK